MKEVNIEISGGIGCGKSIIMREISKMMFYKFGVDVKSPQLHEELIGNDLDNPEDWQLDAIKSTLWTMGESSINSITKKPRTETEFVKCEFTSDKERAEAFIEGGLRYFTHGPVTGDKEKDTIPVTRLDELLCGSGIYRKVETEIDERHEFVETYNNLASVSMPLSIDEWAGLMYDSGKFKLVEM